MSENQCVFAGSAYSEGAVIEASGQHLQCVAGAWRQIGGDQSAEDTARLLRSVFADTDAGIPTLVVPEIDGEDEIASHRFSRLRAVRCSSFVESGLASLINLANSCAHDPMVTVRWLSGPQHQDCKYRLQRGRSRLIRVRGQVGSIVGEAPWDFDYGDDVKASCIVRRYMHEGGIYWTFWNPTNYHVCFKTKIAEDGNEHITNWGVAAPGEEIRLWWSYPGIQSACRIVSARADPQ